MALKNDLVAKLATKLGMTKKASEEAVDLVFSEISGYLKKGEEVRVTGFGKFYVKKREERKGVNPRHPEETLIIKARKVPLFKPGKQLKQLIAK